MGNKPINSDKASIEININDGNFDFNNQLPINWRNRIDNRMWDEFNDKIRDVERVAQAIKDTTLYKNAQTVAFFILSGGIVLLTLSFNTSNDKSTWIPGVVLGIVITVLGATGMFYCVYKANAIASRYKHDIRRSLNTTLDNLNTKYYDSIHFNGRLNEKVITIKIELRTNYVSYKQDINIAPQIMNQQPNANTNQKIIQVQMPDGSIASAVIVGKQMPVNYGAVSQQPLLQNDQEEGVTHM
eukprot:318117_1